VHAFFDPVTVSVLLGLGAADLRHVGVYVICLVLATTVHEFSHAFTAHKLGDPTPEGQGRLTLNPIAHADPIGTVALPITLGLLNPGMLFGWGRPVQTQSRYYTRKITMRAGMALVAFAGPLSNLVMAALTIVLVFALASGGVVGPGLDSFHPLRVFFLLNLVLFMFNLLPLHPLDGGKVLAWLMGPRYNHVDEFLLRYGGIILLVLVIAVPVVLQILFGPVFRVGNVAFEWALARGGR
jgi:Zn-dependent protease